MMRLSDNAASRRGRLEMESLYFIAKLSSSSVGWDLKRSWSLLSGSPGVPKYPLSRNDFLFRLPLASWDGGGVSIEGRIGESCRRGGSTTIVEFGVSISKTGNLDVLDVLRDRRPLSLLDMELARPRFSGSRDIGRS